MEPEDENCVLRDNNLEFTRHLTYFTSAIGPIVEEAFFINEALNDMKGSGLADLVTDVDSSPCEQPHCK